MAFIYSTSHLQYPFRSAEVSLNRRYDPPSDYFDMEAFDCDLERRKSGSMSHRAQHALRIDAYGPGGQAVPRQPVWYGYYTTGTGMDIPINSDGYRERYIQTLRDQVGVDPAKTNSLPLPGMDEEDDDDDDDDDDIIELDVGNGRALTSLPRVPPNACDSPAESQLSDEFDDDIVLLRNGEDGEDDDLYMTPPPEERPIAPLPRRSVPLSSSPSIARNVLSTSRASSPASIVDVPLAQSSCASPTSHDVKSLEPPAPKPTGRKRKAQTVASSMPPRKRRGRPPRSRAPATRDLSAASTPAPPPTPTTITPTPTTTTTTATATTPTPTPVLTIPAPTPALSTPAPTPELSTPTTASPTPAPAPATSSPSETSFVDITNAAGELLSQQEIEDHITVIVDGVQPTSQGDYPCPLGDCPQVCGSRGDLRRHLRKLIHMRPSLRCDGCGKMYTREDALKRHHEVSRRCLTRHR